MGAMRRRYFSVGAALVLVGLLDASSSVRAQTPDADLAKARDAMLQKYSDFKQYGLTNPQQIYARLSADRQAVFDAVMRALFLELEDQQSIGTNVRIITFLDAVHGIWGVRPGDSEGKHQFRVSVRWKPGLAAALSKSGNMPSASKGHVIMPKQSGGDDSPTFNEWDVREDGVTTHRQASREPKIQISYFTNNQTVGEIDIDFDALDLLCLCHCQPSNSDVGSFKNAQHGHKNDFNVAYPFFTMPLTPVWNDTTHHCKKSY